jgi:hypothetical protein
MRVSDNRQNASRTVTLFNAIITSLESKQVLVECIIDQFSFTVVHGLRPRHYADRS